MIRWIALLSAGSALSCKILFSATLTAATLKPGPYLFIDDALIAQSSNMVRTIHSPKRDLPEPVVTAKEDKNFQPYITVLRDHATQRFRMWYNVPVDSGQSHLAHIESADGIHWQRPHQVLDDPGRIAFGASVLDEGQGFGDRGRRYKYVWYNGGMMLACSPDGIHWKAEKETPVISSINDILHLARDTARGRYIAVFGFPSRPEDGYQGKTQNAAEGYRRCVGQSTSRDGVNWQAPRRIIAPDNRDEGITEYYSIGGVVNRGDLLIGLLKVLRDDLPCDPGGKVDGLGYTVRAWSHDGENWQRDRQPFFDRNHEPGTWDHAMAWMDYQQAVGDEIYVYYGGYARGHKVERFAERQIGLVRMKRDRYVARESAGEGWLRTPPMKLEGNVLTLNVNATRGEVRVQIRDERGQPIPEFGFSEFEPITTDEVAAPAKWKRSLSILKGKIITLEFAVRGASLFAFDVRDVGF